MTHRTACRYKPHCPAVQLLPPHKLSRCAEDVALGAKTQKQLQGAAVHGDPLRQHAKEGGSAEKEP